MQQHNNDDFFLEDEDDDADADADDGGGKFSMTLFCIVTVL